MVACEFRRGGGEGGWPWLYPQRLAGIPETVLMLAPPEYRSGLSRTPRTAARHTTGGPVGALTLHVATRTVSRTARRPDHPLALGVWLAPP
jgi:hypothetical protein